MQMIVEFDISADLIEVPEWVVRDREVLARRFLRWLRGSDGSRRWKKGGGYCYRSDAFVYWLNKKVMKGEERAAVLATELREWDESLPSVFF